jgi:hypothetical protein
MEAMMEAVFPGAMSMKTQEVFKALVTMTTTTMRTIVRLCALHRWHLRE